MPYLSGSIHTGGPVLDVIVGAPATRVALLQRNGFAVPEPVHVRALIDTGATLSAFAPRVFTALDLRSLDQIEVLTPSTRPDAPHLFERYQVALALVAEGRSCPFPETLVMSADCWLEEEGMEALIGRDILDHCFFQYLGPDRRFTLAFWSRQRTRRFSPLASHSRQVKMVSRITQRAAIPPTPVVVPRSVLVDSWP